MHDDIDRRLLRLWQSDPDLTIAELAELAGLTNAKAQRRLTRLEEAGILKGRAAVIDWAVMGYAVQVSLRVTLDKTEGRAFDEFIDAARDVPEVIEIQTFLGRVDVRLSIIARDMPHYQDIYRGRILTLPHITDIEALMTISQVKHQETLPL
ncbi:Lrp/AsnC family transcriptional regulator [Aestuariibius sp. HNIBRBA575]|uniref:Lrp/AsnC family transcriptional regulator n=1 Tax=Aestuariibius sp. HNIBRBA575 TaxID=3233343 RepID=UPI0034A4AB72